MSDRHLRSVMSLLIDEFDADLVDVEFQGCANTGCKESVYEVDEFGIPACRKHRVKKAIQGYEMVPLWD